MHNIFPALGADQKDSIKGEQLPARLGRPEDGSVSENSGARLPARLGRPEDGSVSENSRVRDQIIRMLHNIMGIQNVSEIIKILENRGMKASVEDFQNKNLEFSRVDGAFLRNRRERMAYLRKLTRLSPIEALWYTKRPIPPPPPQDGKHYENGSEEYATYVTQSYQLKEFTADFIADEYIPYLIQQNLHFRGVIIAMHEFQVKGSKAQLDILRGEQGDDEYGLDIAGKLRKCDVAVDGAYVAVPPYNLEYYFSRFCDKIDIFMQYLKQLKKENILSDTAFSLAVLRIAAYANQRFVDIHPMRDGNGRLGRSLFQYIVENFLGKDYKYKKLPLSKRPDGEITLHPDLMRMLVASQRDLFPDDKTQDQQTYSAKILKRDLEDTTLDSFLSIIRVDDESTTIEMGTGYRCANFIDMFMRIIDENMIKK